MSTIKTNQLAHTANGASVFTLPTTDGSANQVIETNGSGALSFATVSDTKWVYGTAADYDQWTSTTDVTFTGWPSNWQHIRISFNDISSAGSTDPQFFVSKSSNPSNKITTGYATSTAYTGPGQSGSNASDQGKFTGLNNSNYQLIGQVDFYKFSGSIIRYNGQCSIRADNYVFWVDGSVTCDPTSDMTHIFFRQQGYAFDAGKFKIDYLAG